VALVASIAVVEAGSVTLVSISLVVDDRGVRVMPVSDALVVEEMTAVVKDGSALLV